MAISRVPDGPRIPTLVSDAAEVSSPGVGAPVRTADVATASPPTRAADQLHSGGAPLISAPSVALNPSAESGREALVSALADFRALAAEIPSELPAGRKVAGFLELTMPAMERPLSAAERATAQAVAAKLLGASE